MINGLIEFTFLFLLLPDRNCIVPQISKTDPLFMKQKSKNAKTQSTMTMTERPTKTVEARNAGDKIEAKLLRSPKQWKVAEEPESEVEDGSETEPEEDKTVQKRQRPKWPGPEIKPIL